MSAMIWLDFGGVLSPPISELFRDYERRTGVPVALLQRAMSEVAAGMNMPALAPIELGAVTEGEWVGLLRKRIHAIDPLVNTSTMEPEFGRQWFAGHRVNSRMRELLLTLRAEGTHVGILTNNVLEWEQYWRAMVGLDGLVDDVVDSCKVGWRKPDKRIFEVAARRNALLPDECLLIDDLAENCEAARRCGWSAVHFTPTTDVESLVRAFLDA